MARLRPVPPGPDTLGSGVEVGRSIMRPAADPDLALTHRSEVGHAPGTTDPRRAVPAARACAGGRAPTTRASPDHIDTPADLKGADITRTLAIAHLTSTSPPNLTRYAPTTWCGSRLTADDSEFAAFPPTQRQIKVVYAYASGQQDRSAQWSQALQADVSNIEQYLAVQTGGARALRFDMGTECGPQYLDIQVVALPRVREYYRDDPSNFSRLAHDVAAAVGSLSGPRDVFVLADKLTDDPVWGIAQVIDDDRGGAGNESNAGGLTAIMWTNPSTQPDPSDWWQPTVMLHEITHNLGGVQQSAPNHTSNWHCTDGEDVMCYPDGSPEAAAYDDTVCPLDAGAIPQTYDCGHDDYFNPAPAPGSYLDTHWNVYRSAFMGACGTLGMACGRGVVPGAAGQHGAADARRPGRARRAAHGRGRNVAQRAGQLRAALAARRRRRLGQHRRRVGTLLPAHRRGRRRGPARDGHRHQRRRRGDRRLAAHRADRRVPRAGARRPPTPKAPRRRSASA